LEQETENPKLEAKCDIRIGTSGWYYNHWRGPFYPAGLPKNKWFEYYAERFDTVEINNTFYRLPKPDYLKRWHRLAPEDFIYSVKANRYITHIKRLKEPTGELERFFERVGILAEKLGPVLYQLPPGLHKDLDRLAAFAKLLPERPPAVFEFRHKSWFSQDTFELLGRLGLAFCIHDMPGVTSPRVVTSDIIYIRFHGPAGKYTGSYSKSALKDWVQWIKGQRQKVQSIYAYFNNDIAGYAIANASQLKEQF